MAGKAGRNDAGGAGDGAACGRVSAGNGGVRQAEAEREVGLRPFTPPTQWGPIPVSRGRPLVYPLPLVRADGLGLHAHSSREDTLNLRMGHRAIGGIDLYHGHMLYGRIVWALTLVRVSLPETVVESLPGRPVSDVIDLTGLVDVPHAVIHRCHQNASGTLYMSFRRQA